MVKIEKKSRNLSGTFDLPLSSSVGSLTPHLSGSYQSIGDTDGLLREETEELLLEAEENTTPYEAPLPKDISPITDNRPTSKGVFAGISSLKWKKSPSEKAINDEHARNRRAILLYALQTPVIHAPKRRTLNRSSSFSGRSDREVAIASQYIDDINMKRIALVAAKTEAQHARQTSNLFALILFEIILILGYTFFRLVACPNNLLGWQCLGKSFQQHWDDITTMCAIGGVIFASGPTVAPGIIIPSLVSFVASMLTFGAFGESPFLYTALNSASTWQPPALYVYVAAIILVVVMVAYAFWCVPSKHDLFITCGVVVLIVGMYSSAAVAALVGDFHVVFHPHHYAIAWHLSLLFRNESDAPCILIRWILFGVYVQGISAYSAASLLDDGHTC